MSDEHEPEPQPEAQPGPSRAEQVAALRPAYQADLARGLDRFFEPERTTCPWCGSSQLKTRLRTTDLLQHKPGRFTLDRCQDCRHTFQNPRLSGEGLEFYYRDFYDGLGEKQLSNTFAGRTQMYRQRAESLLPFASAPKNWLDVGTGHGHFCESARTVYPGTAFDGLDFTDGAELAERAGRVERGFRGSFVELAPEVAGNYDVVSMFHYLEHSTEPGLELEAAHQAIRPGGHLLIEVPDPDSRYARLLGRWWLPWLQPQHLHFVPVANLRRRLTDLGFTVVAEQHAEPHDPVDLLAATWLALDAVAPRDDFPWQPERPNAFRRTLRGAMVLAGVPALVLGTLLDRFAVRPLSHRLGVSNAYRLLARRD
ncbi:class I SAM-dependent methyltransferase [Actinacidiphila oryziradicis]|uniref:Class I SAM-dependent methyltransferase n=1 Tax=Actinacidiphila oryziradicis TaxID=2571141 RepID=A0A4U0SLB7_9ACTN|nr:class I SAM-dependent methyltransferase [Actinacidiphila oryziradicis]TKA10426.1 class I SAM-dependent methyltransferase [Actinacidiphila oryziradicis]